MNNKLQRFAQNELVLARSAVERQRINSSLSQLEKVITNKLQIQNLIRFGSYTRNTILPRKFDNKSDVDLMVIFNSRYTPETYRGQIAKAINTAYPNSLSKKDFPAVKLELNHIMFDIVPAIIENNYWSGTIYLIPDKGNNWIKTEPNDINDDLSQKNQSYGGNVIRQVIRLCKHWNANAGYPLSSYLMEKKIISLWYWGNENTYERFLKTLDSIAGHLPKVRKCIDNIRKYEGVFYEQNKIEQLYWLQKLLPGLK
ncbi:MAG: hypothetical protein N4A35_01695 [Flavobacteriales bacterium]|jgi:predicted nucleotidyltransferase|nr:hypothetical protein [Flavobacteriales bacterium]